MIVSAIDLNAPGWLVVIIAITGIVGAIRVMKQVKARLGADDGPAGPPGGKPDSPASARQLLEP